MRILLLVIVSQRRILFTFISYQVFQILIFNRFIIAQSNPPCQIVSLMKHSLGSTVPMIMLITRTAKKILIKTSLADFEKDGKLVWGFSVGNYMDNYLMN